METFNIISLDIFKTMVNLLVVVLNNLKEDEQFEGINYLLVSINGFKKSIKWYANGTSVNNDNNEAAELVTTVQQTQHSLACTERPYGIALAKFLSNCRTIFEPNIINNNNNNNNNNHNTTTTTTSSKDVAGTGRLNNKLMRIKTSQVAEMIQHMFDGVGGTSNINTSNTIARIRSGDLSPTSLAPPPSPLAPRSSLSSISEAANSEQTTATRPISSATPASEWNASDMDDDEDNDDDEDDDSHDGTVADLDDSLDRITSSISATSDVESLMGSKKVRLKKLLDDDGQQPIVERKRAKRKLDSFNCFQCPKSYRKRKSLILHYKQHRGFCHDCGVYRGLTTPEIVAHNQEVHIKQFPCICELCGDSFSRNQQYQVHLVLHSKEKSYACPECGEKFPLMGLYKKHLAQKNHKGHMKMCEICGASFDGNDRLAQHLTRTHRKDATLKCGHCDMRFAINDNLKRHERMHLEVEKMFVCEHCGSEYFTNSALKDHYTAAHTNIRPFECEICKKRFIHQRSLRKHAQSHSDERPFGCNLCEQAFKHKTHLVRHKQMVHSEVPIKKKIKRLQENQNGELVPVDIVPRAKPVKATAASKNSGTISNATAPSTSANNKQFQPFSDNNMFFSKGKQIQFTSTGIRGQSQQHQTIQPIESNTNDHQLLDFVHSAGPSIHQQQTVAPQNHPTHQHQQQPNQQLQQNHIHMQLHQQPHPPSPIQHPPPQQHQLQPNHQHHHQVQLQQPQQQQHHHHQHAIQSNNFDALDNSNFQQGFHSQDSSQYFKFSAYNHQSTVNNVVPPSQTVQPPPQQPAQPSDQMFGRGNSLAYDMLVEPNQWNITDNATNALNAAAASADIDLKDNKMFSLLEMGSPDFMHVDMPQFCKPDLSDMELLQYQNLWSADSTQMDYNSTGIGTSQQANTYNNIGNILTNLELLGNNSNFDASNFEIITSNYEQVAPPQQQPQPLQPQKQQQQQPLQQQQQPLQQQHHHLQHGQQTHQMQPEQNPHQNQSQSRHQLQQQHHQTLNSHHNQNHHHQHQQHAHKVIDTVGDGGGLMNNDSANYFNIPAAAAGSVGYSVQNIDTMGRSAMGYQNHTITDISNTFLTENQRNNLQHISSGSGSHVHQLQPHNASLPTTMTSLEQTMPSLNDYLQ